MTDTLIHAYGPLVGWIGAGVLLAYLLPSTVPHLLGRWLYWVGVPWEIFALARQTDFSEAWGIAPWMLIASLLVGFTAAWLSVILGDRTHLWTRSHRGSFLLAATLGNTGFVGLGLIPSLVSEPYWGWAVLYNMTQNIVGTFGLGVMIASFFGRSADADHPRWQTQVRDLLTVPSLWAFGLGTATRSFPAPDPVEWGLHLSLGVVIPLSFLLIGLRLSQIQGLRSLRAALVPSFLKIGVMPLCMGLATHFLGLTGEARLVLVLMAGMPSAFAGLILAEEYDLDWDVIASSILLTTIALLFTIPLWLWWFG